uniref:Uncharacterized protein n=1 Tax=Utricularia reniformis TaxID=192314 RepID=A0A1Y0AYX5_9LAMI|nr:hypothetical protein AEK19_MT1280 [Utricularia reniformis]ART30366.1 hypothetical protein AEK19_MT1280 [Utricularia reniformis]
MTSQSSLISVLPSPSLCVSDFVAADGEIESITGVALNVIQPSYHNIKRASLNHPPSNRVIGQFIIENLRQGFSQGKETRDIIKVSFRKVICS